MFVILLDDILEFWLSLDDIFLKVKFIVWVGNCILFSGIFKIKIV